MSTFIQAHDDWLTVARLPAYAPELNAVDDIIFRYSSKVGVEALREIISELENISLKSELNTRLLAASLNADELKVIIDQPITGVQAWEALALKEDATFADLAREILDTDASPLIATLPDVEDSEQKEKLIDYLCARSRQAALYLLMHLPAGDRTEGDITRARTELQRNHWLTRDSAVSAVAALGTSEDAAKIVEMAQSTYPEKRRLDLLSAAINLGGKDFAINLPQAMTCVWQNWQLRL